MNTWRQFPSLDPELPLDALPEGWPLQRARETFTLAYDGLGPLAELRFRQILARHEPALAELAGHRTAADWAADC
jgi:phenylacetic acid degradation operon negative regulatory protein